MPDLRNLIIRPVTLLEGNKFVIMMNKAYTRKKTLEYFKWQFFDTPLNTTLFGAYLADRLIGFFCFQCRRLNNGLICGQAIDLLVEKKYRGKGIFTRLGQEAMKLVSDKIDFAFVFPNVNGRMATEKGLNWKHIANIKTLMLRDFYNLDCDGDVAIIEKWDDTKIKNNEKDIKDCVYFLRGKKELFWRFAENPEHSYTIVNGEVGYVMVKIFIDPLTGDKFGDIVDFSFSKFNNELLRKLFLQAISYLKGQGVMSVTVWAIPNTQIFLILKEIGFSETNQERYFYGKVFRDGLDYLYNIKNWFVVESDTEIY